VSGGLVFAAESARTFLKIYKFLKTRKLLAGFGRTPRPN
jgi:hypothetical protein